MAAPISQALLGTFSHQKKYCAIPPGHIVDSVSIQFNTHSFLLLFIYTVTPMINRKLSLPCLRGKGCGAIYLIHYWGVGRKYDIKPLPSSVMSMMKHFHCYLPRPLIFRLGPWKGGGGRVSNVTCRMSL